MKVPHNTIADYFRKRSRDYNKNLDKEIFVNSVILNPR